ncbi:hypothetical protein BK133_05515 [Paenibacillus sp. FSL H8-0548]|uniref:hypothetical protein n=1 Tax=Paenibacillus sp. FSL H8-0548 TaxID=1920422 RepID=UPI00096E9F93|nr:hypothetical protein [Paenibacillus sp. FSL H8-0548]OMF37513.1 hypothetical protein BK133_05515 [Paenibacillus sp. FSL H8-0548]
MNERLKTTFWLLGYAFLTGLMLTVFSLIEEFYRYLFSLLALYLGIRFFRRFETLGLRIGYFVLSVIFYLLIAVIVSMFIYVKQYSDTLPGV